LTKGGSTISEVIEKLGEPSRRYVDPGDREVLEYVSVKTRESYERTFGVIHDRMTQSLCTTLTLTFEQGILFSKEQSSKILRGRGQVGTSAPKEARLDSTHL
jgi:hypothetical protein